MQRISSALPLIVLTVAMASIPVWPAFISLAALTPPGISLIPKPLAVADLAACILATVCVVVLLMRERSAPPALAKPMAAYVLAWIAASLLGFDPATGLYVTSALVMGVVFHAGIEAWYARPHVAFSIFATFLLTGTLVSLLGVAMVFLRRPAVLYTMVHGRATATFIVPGEFAGYLLLLIPTALGVVLTAQSRVLRGLAIAALASGSIALAATYSRTGWLAAAAGGVFLACMSARSRMRALVYAGATVMAIGAGITLLFHGHHNPSEDFVRLQIWNAGLRAIELFPLTGTGPGAFRHVYPLLRPVSGEPSAFHVHNVVLTAFAETGVIGIAALFFLWGRFIGAMRLALRGASHAKRMLALAVATGLIATWAQGMLDFVQVIVLGCWLPFMALSLQAARQGLDP